jgi:hypothetical protein
MGATQYAWFWEKVMEMGIEEINIRKWCLSRILDQD